MAGKKQVDATGNLKPDDPTQVLPKGTKTGLPKRRDVMGLIDRLKRQEDDEALDGELRFEAVHDLRDGPEQPLQNGEGILVAGVGEAELRGRRMR